MDESIESSIVVEVISVLGKRIRTHKTYWEKIILLKHPEATLTLEQLALTLTDSDIVYQSPQSDGVFLYVKAWEDCSIIVVVRHVNGDGFVITAYQTTRPVKKRSIIWQK